MIQALGQIPRNKGGVSVGVRAESAGADFGGEARRLTMRCTCRPFWTNQNGRFWPKADLNFGYFDQIGTSAFRSKADIKLNLPKPSANDPKRTFEVSQI